MLEGADHWLQEAQGIAKKLRKSLHIIYITEKFQNIKKNPNQP